MSLSLLFDAVASTTAHRDRDALDDAIARLLFDAINAQRITVYRLIDDAGEHRVQRRLQLARDCPALGPQHVKSCDELPLLRDALHWRECVTLDDIVHFEAPGEDGLRSLFPLAGERHVTGMLEIEAGEGLDPREAQLVRGLLAIVRNHLALLDYGERDTLTGLLNRKTFETHFGKLRQQLGRAVDLSQPSWIGVADIDRFKSINDGYGHLFGDEVLLLVSRLMRRSFRGSDQIFRFGGEEFVMVLPHAALDGAAGAFERLREAVAAHPFPQVGQVSISIGFARILPADTAAQAFERADTALYYAKNNGRNQARCYDRLLEAGAINLRTQAADVELF